MQCLEQTRPVQQNIIKFNAAVSKVDLCHKYSRQCVTCQLGFLTSPHVVHQRKHSLGWCIGSRQAETEFNQLQNVSVADIMRVKVSKHFNPTLVRRRLFFRPLLQPFIINKSLHIYCLVERCRSSIVDRDMLAANHLSDNCMSLHVGDFVKTTH